MSPVHQNSIIGSAALVAALTVSLVLAPSPCAYGQKKKKGPPVTEEAVPRTGDDKIAKFYQHVDISKIVWPNPPAITRIKYLNYWSGEKFVPPQQKAKKKQSWMERMAGVATGDTVDLKPRWQLVCPNGVAVDSKNRVYIADSKVRAIFIVNSDTGAYEMIKSGMDANFKWLTGLAIDDSDRLFSADSGMHRVLIFDANRKPEGVIEGIVSPGGLAVDNENRQLYVADAELDAVHVFDADPPYKLIRRIGKPGTNHTSTAQGEFAKPTGVAVDQDGNLYVSDTWNNRIQIFDAEGTFIRTFGKAGDGPGYFARPKGIAIDSDGHLWVADALQDRVQVFTPEGRLLIWLGGHGLLPGQFQSLVNLTMDRNNRLLTTEQMPGRMQIFRYIPDAEARAEKERREKEPQQKR